jgi:hypothetical protein
VGIPIIPVLGRLRQEDYKFEVILGYIMRVFQKTTHKTTTTKPTTNRTEELGHKKLVLNCSFTFFVFCFFLKLCLT